MRPVTSALLAACLVAALSTPVQAQWNYGQTQRSRILSDRWSLQLGGFNPTFKTDVAIGTPTLIGTLIRLEDTLGLEDDINTFRGTGIYRFNKKAAILVDYASLNRSAATLIDTEIEIADGEDNLTFAVGALVASTFDNDIYTVNYRHSFINTGRTEAGFSAGISGFAFKVALQGIASVDDGVNPPVVREAQGGDSLVIPVPAFGLFINHAFTQRCILRMNAGFLNLDVGDYDGRYTNTNVTIEYFFSRHVGIGGGVSRQTLDFSNTGGTNPYTVGYSLGGPNLYLSLAF